MFIACLYLKYIKKIFPLFINNKHCKYVHCSLAECKIFYCPVNYRIYLVNQFSIPIISALYSSLQSVVITSTMTPTQHCHSSLSLFTCTLCHSSLQFVSHLYILIYTITHLFNVSPISTLSHISLICFLPLILQKVVLSNVPNKGIHQTDQ